MMPDFHRQHVSGGSSTVKKRVWHRQSLGGRVVVLSLSLSLLVSTASFGAVKAQQQSVPQVLRSVQSVRHLSTEAAAKNPEVHVRAVVTYYDTVAPNLFVQDATGGIWVELGKPPEDRPVPGQLIDLQGRAASGFTPYISKPRWTVAGKASLPKPVHLTYEQASTGSFDGQWVEMDGVVRSFVQQAEGNVLVMDVGTPTGTFKVRVPDYHTGFPMYLVDAKVRFHGVCGAAFNRRNQLVAIHLMMPSLEQSEVLEPAPSDPFAVPMTQIGNIRQFSAEAPDPHRVKVDGIVTARYPGRGLFLMDPTGGVYVESQDGTPVEPGDEVEVIGFPAAGNYSPVLKSGSIRQPHGHRDLRAADIAGRMALKGGYDAQLVNISATVLGYRRYRDFQAMVLESDDHVGFEASYSTHTGEQWPVAVGSKVILTGVCSVRADDNGNASDFQIVLRSPADIRVVSAPPWLNAGRALLIASGLGLLTVAVVGWVMILRRRVRKQTEIIRLKLQHEAALEERYSRIFERNLTGLYVARQDGTIIECNDACARILGFSGRQDLLENHSQAEQIIRQFSENPTQDSPDQIVNAEHRFQRRDNSWGWVLSNARLVEQKDDGTTVLEGGLIDITDRKAAEEQVHFLAYYDSLTGLPNRTLLRDRLEKALAGAKRHKDRVAVLFLDLDRFKMVNDSLGHSCGDFLLQEVARRLRHWAREQDTVARWGGDEFVLVLSNVKEAADAAVAAERIAQAVAAEYVVQAQNLNVTCSIGISMFPEHGADVETLIKHADAAMYYSKDGGRDTFRFFTEEMNAQVIERLRLENSLRGALDKQQLFLMYQPEIEVSTGRVTCCEALLRWHHPELGLVPPDKFIRIAENSGTIIPIGEWVLRTACAQARKWQEEGLPIPVAVNVSAVQFRQEGFCAMVKAVLQETGLDPRYLELELTESLLLSNEDVMFQVLGDLQDLGLRLAIDDFGTGYSSLSYLKQFPVSKLKIDRTFIRDVAENVDDAAIAAAIINMAKCLNLKVTAEGVESEAQFTLLQAHNCDQVQGFLFSRPLNPKDLGEMLRQRTLTVDAASGVGDKTPDQSSVLSLQPSGAQLQQP